MNRRFSFILLAVILSFAAFNAYAQDDTSPKKVVLYDRVVQTSPEGSRFELLVTTTEESRIVFRFDKFTGDLWELSNGFRPLKLMSYTRETDPRDVAEEGRINYQLVMTSSTGMYLINLHTGVMWEKTPDDLFRRQLNFQIIREQ